MSRSAALQKAEQAARMLADALHELAMEDAGAEPRNDGEPAAPPTSRPRLIRAKPVKVTETDMARARKTLRDKRIPL